MRAGGEIRGEEPDGRVATVSWRSKWSSHEYPGERNCVATVYDDAGEEIGRQRFQMASLMPEPGTLHDTVVHVRGAPAFAEMACGATREDTPAAYRISDVRVEAVGEQLVISFDVAWPAGVDLPDYPGTNACTAVVIGEGVRVHIPLFTLAVPPGPRRLFLRDERLAGYEPSELEASVECHPFSGADAE